MSAPNYLLKTLAAIYISLTPFSTALANSAYKTDLSIKDLTSISREANYKPYSANAIQNIMLAEISISRSQPELAIQHYLIAAKEAQSAELAKTATDLAIQMYLVDYAREAAVMWATLSPSSLEPQMVAITLTVDSDENLAKKFLKKALQIEPASISDHIQVINAQIQEQYGRKLYSIINDLLKNDPNNEHLLSAAAYLAIYYDDVSKVKELTNKALKISPNLTPAIELKAKLIRHETESDLEALAYLEDMVKNNPKDSRLRSFLASALVDSNQLAQATVHLRIVTKDKEHAGEAFFALSEIYVMLGNFNEAINALKSAIPYDDVTSQANFMLGQLYEIKGDEDSALQHYQEVTDEMLKVPANMQAISILKNKNEFEEALRVAQDTMTVTIQEQKELLLIELDLMVKLENYDEALSLVNQALKVLPNDTELLFMRSNIAKFINRIDIIEKDLITILSHNPKNTKALELLGSTLASEAGRTQDAIKYLQQSVNIQPDNPVTLSKLGWLLYKAGDPKAALVILEKAYAISDTPSTALHLVEVLNSLGKAKRAMHIIEAALKKSPDDSKLIDLKAKTDKIMLDRIKVAR